MQRGVLELRPTQFVLGKHEVEAKIAKIESLRDGKKSKKLEDWLDEHHVPCVAAPSGQLYLIDHHHFLSACYHAGLTEVSVEILADASKETPDGFWEFLRQKGWCYLMDQFGEGPHDPARLPGDIRWLADDVYRSLAWQLRDEGLIAKVQQPFHEFAWARLLRERLHVNLHTTTYETAVQQALVVAKAAIADGSAP